GGRGTADRLARRGTGRRRYPGRHGRQGGRDHRRISSRSRQHRPRLAERGSMTMAGPDLSTRQLTISQHEKERELQGAERAAVLLLALGERYGRRIWEQLDEVEVRQISAAMARLGPVTPTMLEGLFVDFVKKISSNGALNGNVDVTERLLSSFLPDDRVAVIMEEIRGPAGRNMWEKLSNVQENILANYLKNEYPQTVAVV